MEHMDTANWGKFSMPPTSHLLGEAKTTIDQMYSVLSYMKTHLNHPVVGKVNRDSHPIFGCLLFSIIRHSGRKTHQLLTLAPQLTSQGTFDFPTKSQEDDTILWPPRACTFRTRKKLHTTHSTELFGEWSWVMWCWTQEPWLPGIFTYMTGLNVWVSCR